MINISVQTGRNLSDNNKPGLEEDREAAASQEEIKLKNGEKIEVSLSGDLSVQCQWLIFILTAIIDEVAEAADLKQTHKTTKTSSLK